MCEPMRLANGDTDTTKLALSLLFFYSTFTVNLRRNQIVRPIVRMDQP